LRLTEIPSLWNNQVLFKLQWNLDITFLESTFSFTVCMFLSVLLKLLWEWSYMFLEYTFVHSALLYLYVLAFLWFQGYMRTAETSLLLKPNLCSEELPVVWVMTKFCVLILLCWCCVFESSVNWLWFGLSDRSFISC